MMTDIEIARACKLKKIKEIAESLNISEDDLIPYGKYMAKLPLKLIDEQKISRNRLILVTAITPNKAGIGKTTVSIGLAMALNRMGKKAIAALREPSLGPCFGMKGGAAGGGYSQILPMEKINLHFTGDFHAVTTAHNMIAALLDNYLYRNKENGFGLKEVLWNRVLDINDRNLRQIVTGLGPSVNGIPAQSGFDITPASEIMAILCLAKDIDDLKRRIGNILLGYTYDNRPFLVKDMKVEGAVTALLTDALLPNLVQTTENTPAVVHGGPFANIAHGCNSIIATKTAMSLSDYTVTEAGFGADLGAEKFFNIKCREAGIRPKATVLVATLQSLKLHGGADPAKMKEPDIDMLAKGFRNLDKHIANLRGFGQSIVVTCNRFAEDTDEEIALLARHCEELGLPFASNTCFTEGGKGTEELARKTIETIENHPSGKMEFTYKDTDTAREKIEKIALNIYGAGKVEFSNKALKKLKHIKELEIETYPVCIAKTQYSFSADPKIPGIEGGFTFAINDILINNGAGFIIALAGDIMRMPGLPKIPQALKIDVVNGQIEGLS